MATKSARTTRANATKKAKASRANDKPRSAPGNKALARQRQAAKKRPPESAAKKRAAKSSSTLEKLARSAKGRRIVILFADGLDVPQTKGWKDKPGVWEELKGHPLGQLVPMFADASVVDRLERHGREVRPDYPWPRLRNYFRLYLTSARRSAALVRELRSWKGVVRLAYVDREAIPANGSPEVCLQHSAHVDAAPLGVGAAHAWQFVGGIGEGQTCIDVETGWVAAHARLAHLVRPPCGTLLCGRHQWGGLEHGTCVLGIICGTNPVVAGANPHLGCAGIAPGAEMRLASYASAVEPPPGVLPVPHDNPATEVAENIYAAVSHGISFLRARGGGVLLLEYHTADRLPLEVLPAMRDLLETAKPDVTVVEAAGNGKHNFDAYQDDDGNFPLRRPSRAAEDSGAIMVGSAHSAVVGNRHRRLDLNQSSGSNFGKRLDCYAWGEDIGTPTEGGQGNACDVFGGTSGAAAIIAGVALVVLGLAANGGKQLNAEQLRDLLRNENLGTRCAAGAMIGSMPDLARIAVAANVGALRPRN